jgi:hypothetical protein
VSTGERIAIYTVGYSRHRDGGTCRARMPPQQIAWATSSEPG